MITISENLRSVPEEERTFVLRKYIEDINSTALPADVYIPIDLIGKDPNITQHVLKIREEYSLCLSSKERVPFHILVELIEEVDETNKKEDEHFLRDTRKSTSESNFVIPKRAPKKSMFSGILCCFSDPFQVKFNLILAC